MQGEMGKKKLQRERAGERDRQTETESERQRQIDKERETERDTHTRARTHTHTHILIPFEDRKPTGLKVDIAEDADKLVLSHLLTSRECKTRRTLPSNSGSKWPTQQT